VPVPSGGSGLDIDLLESTLRQVSPRLVYLIPDHRNPTGTSLDDDERAQVRALARRYRTAIVGDEVLTELTLDGPTPSSFTGDGTASAHVLSIGSASKSYWGGLRVGWVRAHPDLIARLAATRAHTDIGTAVLEQLVVAELLAQPTDLLARRRTELRARRDLVVSLLLDQLPSWRFDVPAGGLALWADLGAPVSSALAAISTRHGVRVVPGTAFGVDGSFERNLRLPFTASADDLHRAVAGLAAAWGALGITAPVTGPDRVHALV
jgi:DNA-binding transcriptional MocR family regulator